MFGTLDLFPSLWAELDLVFTWKKNDRDIPGECEFRVEKPNKWWEEATHTERV